MNNDSATADHQPDDLQHQHVPEARLIGLIRFSLLTSAPRHSWAGARISSDRDYRSRLFSDERLETRFRLFETVTLPSLNAQTSKDLIVLIMTSSLLPPRWLQRLRDLVRGHSYIRLVLLEPVATLPALARTAVQPYLPSDGVFGTFRLDDDDALWRHFVTKCRSYLIPDNAGSVVSFFRGMYLGVDASGQHFIFGRKLYPKIGIGLTYVSTAATPRTIFDLGNHSRIDPDAYRLVLDNTRDAWIRTVYSSSDSQDTGQNVFESHFRGRKRGTVIKERLLEVIGGGLSFLNPEEVFATLQASGAMRITPDQEDLREPLHTGSNPEER